MLIHNLVAGNQTQAASPALIGREEGIKQFLERLKFDLLKLGESFLVANSVETLYKDSDSLEQE